ncbi:MAG: hypothetical protein GC186_20030 [Rhodobacteraceae bacterium]|nr:hypothetical protein [Paracoccaceae bacterium]
MYRQGDVLLVPYSGVPAEAQPEPVQNGRVVLAEGERTGHAHTMLADRVAFFREDGAGRGGYLRVDGLDPVALSHEEHATVQVPPGNYRVIQQREYLPRSGPRRVSD